MKTSNYFYRVVPIVFNDHEDWPVGMSKEEVLQQYDHSIPAFHGLTIEKIIVEEED